MSLKDHMTPRKDWTRKQWLEHACVQMHNPWISEDDRQYWRDKAQEMRK